MTDDAVLAALDALIAGFAAAEPHQEPQAPRRVATKKAKTSMPLGSQEPNWPHPGGIPPISEGPAKQFQNLYTSGSGSGGHQTQGVQVDDMRVARAEGLSSIDVANLANLANLAPVAPSLFTGSATYARSRREAMWHLEHGERVEPGICAGCRRPIRPGADAWQLADDNRVHIGPTGDPDSYACLIAHGRRWRRAARAAVSARGWRIG